MPNEILTTAQLAERLLVDRKTIINWVRAGRIPAMHISRSTYRFDLEEVMAALKASPQESVKV